VTIYDLDGRPLLTEEERAARKVRIEALLLEAFGALLGLPSDPTKADQWTEEKAEMYAMRVAKYISDELGPAVCAARFRTRINFAKAPESGTNVPNLRDVEVKGEPS
jgi:hypothetical protein